MTGYSWFTLPKVSWDFAFDKNSKNLIASFLFFELDVTPAPLTLICVPLPCWFGKNTATLLATSRSAFSAEKADRDVASKVAVFFPNQQGRGTHINVSGAGVTSSSKNKKEAIKFLEFLSNAKSQETFGNVNHEYPVMIETNQSSLLKSWGSFKYDSINLSILGANNSEAVKLFDRAGWE